MRYKSLSLGKATHGLRKAATFTSLRPVTAMAEMKTSISEQAGIETGEQQGKLIF